MRSTTSIRPSSGGTHWTMDMDANVSSHCQQLGRNLESPIPDRYRPICSLTYDTATNGLWIGGSLLKCKNKYLSRGPFGPSIHTQSFGLYQELATPRQSPQTIFQRVAHQLAVSFSKLPLLWFKNQALSFVVNKTQ